MEQKRQHLVELRAPLGEIESNSSRLLGLSPVKPVARSLAQPASMLSGDDKSSYQVMSDVGLEQIDDESAAGYSYILKSKHSIALLIGRARHPFEDTALTPISSDSQTVGSTRVCRVPLPSSAKHVSRDHAIIFHSPFGKTWAVKILGQNGLIVNGKRRKAGLVLRLVPFESSLDFFGVQCLFVGDAQYDNGESIDDSSVLANSVDERGLSPIKRNHSLLSRSSLGNEASRPANLHFVSLLLDKQLQASPTTRKLTGNVQKRPLGAPPSPPTSSPIHFARSSSPLKPRGGSITRKTLSSPPSSSAVMNSNDDSSSDDDYQDGSASPSLSRMSAKYGDSAIMLPRNSDEKDEEEASQALTMANDMEVQEQDIEMLEAEEESVISPMISPSSIPKGRTMSKKQVTFNSQTITNSISADDEIADESISAPQAMEKVDSQPASTSLAQDLQSHLRGIVSRLAETYDIQGLLAEAIVFHRTATISATEAVRSVLTSNPGLLRGEIGPNGGLEKGTAISGWTFDQIEQDGLLKNSDIDKERIDVWQRKAWREKLEEHLFEGDCFGIISRAGKDSSGNPLECWYYYDKENDTDRDRAANLGALAKPMRAALKTHKPIFWKKSAYGHSNNIDGSKGDSSGLVTESQWGSSGSTLDSLLFTKPGEPKVKEESVASSEGKITFKWEETQYEEREKTWDRVGDDDFEVRAAKKIRRRR